MIEQKSTLPPLRELPPSRLAAQRADLVALVDQPRHRGFVGSPRRVVAVAAAAAVIAGALALLPAQLDRRSPAMVEAALAAVSAGPVLHAVLEVPVEDITISPEPTHYTVADLATGEVRPVIAQMELWYDPNGRPLH